MNFIRIGFVAGFLSLGLVGCNTETIEGPAGPPGIGAEGPAGQDGASCTARAITVGIEVSCDGQVIDTLRHGENGDNGVPGADGAAGTPGADGAPGTDGEDGADGVDGTSCSARVIAAGIEVSCGGAVVDTLRNGADGAPGTPGADGAPGTPGADGADGADGAPGADGADGADGAPGADGVNCVVTDDGAGILTQTCGATTVQWPKALCGEQAYEPLSHYCNNGELRAIPSCAGTQYDPETQYCNSDVITAQQVCGLELFNPQQSICDYRDQQIYPFVTIGSQVWMAENLNFSKNSTQGWCYGIGIDSSRHDYAPTCDNGGGRHYSWVDAMDLPQNCYEASCAASVQAPHQGLCPSGWHVPTQAEWNTLLGFVQSEQSLLQIAHASQFLKGIMPGLDLWNLLANNAGDPYGFNALPMGYRNSSPWIWTGRGNYAEFWMATESAADRAHEIYLSASPSHSVTTYQKTYGANVRCLRNN